MAKVAQEVEAAGEDQVEGGVEEPQNYIHVELEGIEQVKGLVVGANVQVIIKGKVNAIEQRQDAKGSSISALTLVDYSSKLVPYQKNVFEDLLDD